LTRVRERYADFGPTLAAEHLAQEGLLVSHETLRKWMVKASLWCPPRVSQAAAHQVRNRQATNLRRNSQLREQKTVRAPAVPRPSQVVQMQAQIPQEILPVLQAIHAQELRMPAMAAKEDVRRKEHVRNRIDSINK
jgi:hypothetical protein